MGDWSNGHHVGNLAGATREELVAIIEALTARVAVLEEEARRLRGNGGKDVPGWAKPNRPQREKKERKCRGQAFVRRRERPDEIHEHAVECCPDCGRKLRGGWKHGRHQVIEIVLRQVRVIEHVSLARWCGVRRTEARTPRREC